PAWGFSRVVSFRFCLLPWFTFRIPPPVSLPTAQAAKQATSDRTILPAEHNQKSATYSGASCGFGFGFRGLRTTVGAAISSCKYLNREAGCVDLLLTILQRAIFSDLGANGPMVRFAC